MDCEGAPHFVERQGGEQPGQPEAVVAVEVRDEDMAQMGQGEPLKHHRALGALAAVDHYQLAVVRNHLA